MSSVSNGFAAPTAHNSRRHFLRRAIGFAAALSLSPHDVAAFDTVRGHIRAAAPDARFYAGDDPTMTCGLTVAEIPGVDSSALQQRLRNRHGLLVQAMTDNPHSPRIRGIRGPGVAETAGRPV